MYEYIVFYLYDMSGKIIKNIYRVIKIYQSDIEYDMVVYVGNKFSIFRYLNLDINLTLHYLFFHDAITHEMRNCRVYLLISLSFSL